MLVSSMKKAVRMMFSGLIFLCSSIAVANSNWQESLVASTDAEHPVELFRVAGSNTLGDQLTPMLLERFFRDSGAEGVVTLPVPNLDNVKEVRAVFVKNHTRIPVQVTVEAKGSSTGFKSLVIRKADLAASSRPIKSTEIKALNALGDMQSVDSELIVAIDGLAVIVHPDNPLLQLSVDTIQNIFSGKITDWSQVGGKKAAIKLYARDDNSGTYDTFKRLVLGDKKLAARSQRYESNHQLSLAVQRDVSAIGFVALPAIDRAKALEISDGVALSLAPSAFTVATEDYPLARRLYFYAPQKSQRKAVVSAFLDFVHSNEGQAVVAKSGYVAQSLFAFNVPVADERLQNWQRLNLNIRFLDGSSALDNKSLMDVQRLADFLEQPENQNVQVSLVGFSNKNGGVDIAAISRLRAQNVRWALRNQGIKHKVQTLAGGAVLVADPGSLNADRNRRVEVWVKY